jgi:hypothetical protein
MSSVARDLDDHDEDLSVAKKRSFEANQQGDFLYPKLTLVIAGKFAN